MNQLQAIATEEAEVEALARQQFMEDEYDDLYAAINAGEYTMAIDSANTILYFMDCCQYPTPYGMDYAVVADECNEIVARYLED